MKKTTQPDITPNESIPTPDKAIDMLRSFVFDYERRMTGTFTWTGDGGIMKPLSQDAAEAITEDYHGALVLLQRFVDAQETGGETGEETSLP